MACFFQPSRYDLSQSLRVQDGPVQGQPTHVNNDNLPSGVSAFSEEEEGSFPFDPSLMSASVPMRSSGWQSSQEVVQLSWRMPRSCRAASCWDEKIVLLVSAVELGMSCLFD